MKKQISKESAIYFETEEELRDRLNDVYEVGVVVGSIHPEISDEPDKMPISIGYQRVAMPTSGLSPEEARESEKIQVIEKNDVLLYQVPDIIEATAYRFRRGYIVDFGDEKSVRGKLRRHVSSS